MLWQKSIAPVIYVERKLDAAPRQQWKKVSATVVRALKLTMEC